MKLALLQNLPGVEAEERLAAGDTAGLSAEAYHALVLAATGSPAEAERRTRARMAAQLRAGVTPH